LFCYPSTLIFNQILSLTKTMNDQFELFQDENTHRSISVRGPSIQPTVLPTNGTQDGFGPSKGVLSSRKALGNITNNTGSFSVSHKQALGGNPSHNNKNVGQQHRNRRVDGKPSFSKTLAESEAVEIDKRLDDLVKGGIERSAGPTWEEQQALKELEMESAFPWGIVDNYEQITRSRMSNIFREIVNENKVEAKVRYLMYV